VKRRGRNQIKNGVVKFVCPIVPDLGAKHYLFPTPKRQFCDKRGDKVSMPDQNAYIHQEDYDDRFEEFILNAIQSDLREEGSEIRKTILQSIDSFVAPSENTIPDDLNFLSVLRLLLAKLIIDAYLHPEALEYGLGLILVLLRLFDYVHSGKSIDSIFRLSKDPEVGKKLFKQLSEDSEIVRVKLMIPNDALETWLTEEISSVSSRTAERQYNKARSVFFKTILRIAPELSGCFKKTAAPRAVQPEPVVDVVALIKAWMSARCSKSAPAFGVELPISSCIQRRLRIGDEIVTMDFADVANWLRGHCGYIAGTRCSGRSTLLKGVAYQVISTESEFLVCYLRAPEFREAAEKHIDVIKFIAMSILGKEDAHVDRFRKVMDELYKLDQQGRLVVLVDDLELLDQNQQMRVIAQLASCRSVYFAITPNMKEFVVSEIKRGGYEGKVLNVELLDLDAASQNQLASSVCAFIGIDYLMDRVPKLLEAYVTDLARIPLGTLAVIQCQLEKRGLFPSSIAMMALSEWVRRAGYDHWAFPGRIEDLQLPVVAICQLGGALYNFLVSCDYRHSDYPEFQGEHDRSTIWIPWQYIEKYTKDRNVSVAELQRLRILEMDPGKSKARIVYKELEILAGALYGFYHPEQIRSGPFTPLLSGWVGEVIQNIKNVQRQVPLLRDIFLDTAEQGRAPTNPGG
jgi:hypothetical protein